MNIALAFPPTPPPFDHDADVDDRSFIGWSPGGILDIISIELLSGGGGVVFSVVLRMNWLVIYGDPLDGALQLLQLMFVG